MISAQALLSIILFATIAFSSRGLEATRGGKASRDINDKISDGINFYYETTANNSKKSNKSHRQHNKNKQLEQKTFFANDLIEQIDQLIVSYSLDNNAQDALRLLENELSNSPQIIDASSQQLEEETFEEGDLEPIDDEETTTSYFQTAKSRGLNRYAKFKKYRN